MSLAPGIEPDARCRWNRNSAEGRLRWARFGSGPGRCGPNNGLLVRRQGPHG
jgi:hypothetical protein